jgi:hypothetical protein
MSKFAIIDPTELKETEVFKQAKLLGTKTSRASSAEWYKDPLEIQTQWHLWFDGGRDVVTAVYSSAHEIWKKGPDLPLSTLTTGEGLADIVKELPTYLGVSKKLKSLGVVFHVGDELAFNQINNDALQTLNEDDDYNLLMMNLSDNPKDFLSGKELSEDTTSWRFLPFWGAGEGQIKGTALAIARSRESFFDFLHQVANEIRVPIRTSLTCAPAEAIAALPALGEGYGKKMIGVFIYRKFTMIAAMDPKGELTTARLIHHRAGSGLPVGLNDVLINLAMAGQLIEQGVKLKVSVQTSSAESMTAINRELANPMNAGQPFEFQYLTQDYLENTLGIVTGRPEFLIYDKKVAERIDLTTRTSRGLIVSGFAKQNFYDLKKNDALYPNHNDLKLFKFGSFLSKLFTLIALALGGYTVYTYLDATQQRHWNSSEMELTTLTQQEQELTTLKSNIEISDKLFINRSSGKNCIEFFSNLLPEDAVAKFISIDYKTEILTGAQDSAQIGYKRVWTISGTADDETWKTIQTYRSSSVIREYFEKIANATQDTSFKLIDETGQPIPTRSVTCDPKAVKIPKSNNTGLEGSSSRSDSRHTQRFDMVIVYTIDAADPLNLPSQPYSAPKPQS